MIARLRAGGRALRDRWRLAAALYGVQLFVAFVFVFAAARALSVTFAQAPLFDRGVSGDLAALSLSLRDHEDLVAALVWMGLALALAYGVLSWWLAAGLVGALRGLPFGDSAARWFWPFVRLWLLSIVPYGVALFLVLLFVGGGTADAPESDALRWGTLVGRPLLLAVPGLLAWALTACAVDHARALLVVTGDRGATRAFLGAFRLIFRHPAALAHYLLYALVWLAIGAAYVAGTFDARTSLGAVLILRQLVALGRFAARFVTVAGQVDATGRYVPSARAPGTGDIDPRYPRA